MYYNQYIITAYREEYTIIFLQTKLFELYLHTIFTQFVSLQDSFILVYYGIVV